MVKGQLFLPEKCCLYLIQIIVYTCGHRIGIGTKCIKINTHCNLPTYKETTSVLHPKKLPIGLGMRPRSFELFK